MPDNAGGARNGGARMAAAGGLSRRAVASILGRFQGPELFITQTFQALTSPILPRNLNLTRPLESIKIMWRGRVAIATANFTTIAAEAPQSIIQRIRLTGTHRLWNQLVPIDISGPSAFAWARLFQVRSNSLYINGTRQADPSVPFAQVGATFGNIGTYDLEIHYDIPLGPMFGPQSRIAGVPFMYLPQDWADTLQLQLFFGDNTSFGTPGTAVTTFSAFGSGAGSPTVTVALNYAILGPLANSIQGAVCIRNENTTVGGPVAAAALAQRLVLLQKQKTTNLVVKSGTLLTGSSAGVQVYGALLDTMLDRTQIILDNKPVRNNQSNAQAKEYAGKMFNTVIPGGYQLFTFVDSQNPLTYYRGDQVPGGSTFELDSDVLTATANQAVSITQEQVFGTPRGK
jgi:hypothetical protein